MNFLRLLVVQSLAIIMLPVAACSSHDGVDGPSSSSAPFFAVNSKRQTYFPEARMRGSFAPENGCVVIKRAGDGMRFTPIFPFASSLESDGVRVNGAHYPFDRELAIGGGQVTLPAYSEVSLPRRLPPACPDTIWVVGNLGEL